MTQGSGILQPRPLIGVGAMMLTTIVVPMMGVFVKILHGFGLNSTEMLAIRSVIVTLVLLPGLLWAVNRAALIAADKKAHLLHAAFGLSSMACFYYAFQFMPLVIVTAINFTTPIFLVLMARFLFGEQLGWRSWVAISVGFLGALIVLQPAALDVGPVAAVVVLGSFLGACMLMAIRRMPARSSNFAVIFYFSIFGTMAFGGLYLPWMDVPPRESWWSLLALAALALAVHSLLTFAYRFSSSMLVGALDYTRLIWAGLLGWYLFNETPQTSDGVGMILILASGFYILYRESRGRGGATSKTAAKRLE
ncbi:EamA family transporter [Alphaproteobacteria bacterium HT1-32]|nr:EamA family transporter [Alphaproteobacteria bacterium HT1-32]|tara:strand:- start:22310 stop:23230 length:921 start_codon:yes stop_codon:yes gene_type:complete